MIVHDPIYGRFRVADHLLDLLHTPEVRRLSQVRLLNSISPSLATVTELRRYSHTLGVLFLSAQNKSSGFSADEWRALEAGVLLHDIGSAAFGHLFEYHLREKATGWDHERMAHQVLWGTHAPENRAHQIFGGRTIDFQRQARRSGIPLDLIQAVLLGKHPLASLLFGAIDLDNIDNVLRMAWALGLPCTAKLGVVLSSALEVGRDGRLCLPQSSHSDMMGEWLRLRRRVYEILVFDAPTVAGQAVLSDAIERAMKAGVLSDEEWFLSDEALIEVLCELPETKGAIVQQYLGRTPPMVACIQVAGSLADLGLRDRAEAKALIEECLCSEFRREKVLGYVFVDNGTFEKQLSFHDRQLGTNWRMGRQSRSLLLYGFVRTERRPAEARCERVASRIVDRIGIAHADILTLRIRDSEHDFEVQRSFSFASQNR
jgi:hypothetical protein